MADYFQKTGGIPITNLPILEKITEAFMIWHNALPQIPRLTRYSLGEKINDLFIELSELVLTASYSSKDQKLPVIQKASVRLDALKFFLHIGWQLKAFDNKKFAELSEPLTEAGKMLGGWQKQAIMQTPR